MTKIWIFHENLDFWRKFGFFTKIWISDENLDFWQKFGCLTNNWIFDENLYFWRKFVFLTQISIFDENFDFRRKFRFLTKISILEETLDFWRKLGLLSKISCSKKIFNWNFKQKSKFSIIEVFLKSRFGYNFDINLIKLRKTFRVPLEVKPISKDVRWKDPVEILSNPGTLRPKAEQRHQNKLVIKELELNSRIVPKSTNFRQIESINRIVESISDSTSTSSNMVQDKFAEDRLLEEASKLFYFFCIPPNLLTKNMIT